MGSRCRCGTAIRVSSTLAVPRRIGLKPSRASIGLLVRTEVAASLEAYRSASEELRVFEAEVLMPARSNQSLLETAYAAGRLDLATALLLRTQLLDAELEYWDAWFAERSVLSALQAAIGGAPPGLNPEF